MGEKNMISVPNLKSIIYYISALDGMAAVYNEKMQLLWSNCNDFFDNVDTSQFNIKEIVKETHYKVEYGGENLVMSINPLYRSKRTVAAFTAVVRNSYQAYKIFGCTSAADYSSMLFNDYEEQTGDLLEMNEKMSEQGKFIRPAELIRSQNRILTNLNTEIGNLAKTLFINKETVTLNCNVTALLLSVCNDAAACLKDLKRKISADLDARAYYTKINFNLFAAAMANLLNCHLNLSPLKTSISVQSYSDGKKIFHIVVKSRSDREDLTEKERLNCDFRRRLAEKLIKTDCGGEFEFEDNGKTAVTEISMSVFLKNRGSMLNVKNSAYLDPAYKPVRALLKKTVECEIEQLEELKMEAAKKKKLDNIS